jgi:hypothetical protein
MLICEREETIMIIRPYFLVLTTVYVFCAFGCTGQKGKETDGAVVGDEQKTVRTDDAIVGEEQKIFKTTDLAATKDKLLVKIGNRSFASGQPVILNVDFPEGNEKGIADLSLEIEGEVSLVLIAPYPSFPTLSVPAVDGPIVEGQASANLFVSGKPVTGVVDVSISHGRIMGSVNDLGITFDGSIALLCNVVSSRIDSSLNAPTPIDDGGYVLINDERFESPECAAVYTALYFSGPK